MMHPEKIKILIIEDEEFDVRRIKNTLAPFQNRIVIENVVSDGNSALAVIKKNPAKFDVIIMDFQILGGLKGEALIRRIKGVDETLQIIVVTKMTVNMTDYDFANKLLEAGAMWYCTKYPGDIEDYIYQPTDFVLSIYNAAEKRKLHRDSLRSTRKLRRNIDEVLEKNKIIGQSESISKLREQIQYCAQINTTVLISGFSGTGKEVVATNIHYQSDRSTERFVPVNCGSLPDHLVESELFGYEKGAFTGATDTKKGLFELANHGTIFLDEIAELPLAAQTKLLRVIQEGELDKIGRTDRVKVNTRIIAATNKNLREEVTAGRFREDLFYRLNVVTLHVPPLAERREDIPLFFEHFMKYFSIDMNQPAPELDQGVMELLLDYPWPGNVRELLNIVQRFLFCHSPIIDINLAQKMLDIAAPHHHQPQHSAFWDKDNIRPWRDISEDVQWRYFQFVRDHSVSDAEAAALLGLAPPNYYRMCKRLGIK